MTRPVVALPEPLARAFAELRAHATMRYDHGHFDQAERALCHVAATHDLPSEAVLREAAVYAAEVLGSVVYAPWLWVYATFAGRFREGWIPDNYYGRYVVALRKGHYGSLVGRRAAPSLIYGGAHSVDLAYRINGRFVTTDFRTLRPDEVADHIFAASDEVIWKLDRSSRGRGVARLTRAGFDPAVMARTGDAVFQSVVPNHPDFAAVMGGALATLRVTTASDPGGAVSVRAVLLKFARAGEDHLTAASRIACAVDPATGAVAAWGVDAEWRVLHAHPDSGAAFAGLGVPGIDALVAAATGLHARVGFIDCIGWDMAITPDGRPVLLEVNATHNGIVASEALVGPCFADLGWESLWRLDPAVIEEARAFKGGAWR